MYAGVSKNSLPNNIESNFADIPEWKRRLIMKKRAGACNDESKVDQTCFNFHGPISPSLNESGSRRVNTSESSTDTSGTCDCLCTGISKFPMIGPAKISGTCEKDRQNPRNSIEVETSSPETVIKTIGNIKVELRSVYKCSTPLENGEEIICASDNFLISPVYEPVCPDSDTNQVTDLHYGPGIVDRLRAKFLNLELKSRRKPSVRKFSSLENLTGSCIFRANALQPRGVEKRSETKVALNGNVHKPSTFKKAQSMETLLVCNAGDNHPTINRSVFSSRVFARPARTAISSFSPVGRSEYSRFGTRIDYNRQISAPSINENELPKPDTVKHFKRIFESPPSSAEKCDKICHAVGNHSNNENIPCQSARSSRSAIFGNACVKKNIIRKQCDNTFAKNSAKSNDTFLSKLNGPSCTVEDEIERAQIPRDDIIIEEVDSKPLSPGEEKDCVILHKINNEHLFVSNETGKPNTSTVHVYENKCISAVSAKQIDIFSRSVVKESPLVEVTPDQSPLIQSPSCSDEDTDDYSQGSQETSEPKPVISQLVVVTSEELHPEADPIVSEDMVVAASEEEDLLRGSNGTKSQISTGCIKKPSNWQKPPPTTTSVVFDFRGKDVKPNISLNPAPFGCRPAKVKKRSGSPPRGESKVNGVDHGGDDGDGEVWDELDIGADLPEISGIVFVGENVKVGRGALLERRNKNLTIQFDDNATSTYEYPFESPVNENCHFSYEHEEIRLKKSSLTIGSSTTTGLFNYTPHGLNSSEEFQLGVSRPPSLRYQPPVPTPNETPVTPISEIIPTTPEDASGWSSSDTADILF